MKEGLKTTELLVSVIVLVMGFSLVLLGKLPADTFIGYAFGTGGLYGGLRTLLKWKNGNNNDKDVAI